LSRKQRGGSAPVACPHGVDNGSAVLHNARAAMTEFMMGERANACRSTEVAPRDVLSAAASQRLPATAASTGGRT